MGKKKLTEGVDDTDPNDVYEIGKQVGDGSFGTVWAATEKTSGRMVALKCVHVESDEELEEFQVEIDILRVCDYVGVVRLFHAFLYDARLWMALEYCGGGSLDDIYCELRQPLSEMEIRPVMHYTFQALVYLHAHGIIHRDIKAGNILLTEDGSVKLCDFGVSALCTGKDKRRNSFIGTPYWMAPEVIICETCDDFPYDGKCDVWSAAITAIELAQLDPPNGDLHPMRVLIAIIKEAAPSLKSDNWSSSFRSFLGLCLQKVPTRRVTAAKALEHDFVCDAVDIMPLRELVALYMSPVVEQVIESTAVPHKDVPCTASTEVKNIEHNDIMESSVTMDNVVIPEQENVAAAAITPNILMEDTIVVRLPPETSSHEKDIDQTTEFRQSPQLVQESTTQPLIVVDNASDVKLCDTVIISQDSNTVENLPSSSPNNPQVTKSQPLINVDNPPARPTRKPKIKVLKVDSASEQCSTLLVTPSKDNVVSPESTNEQAPTTKVSNDTDSTHAEFVANIILTSKDKEQVVDHTTVNANPPRRPLRPSRPLSINVREALTSIPNDTPYIANPDNDNLEKNDISGTDKDVIVIEAPHTTDYKQSLDVPDIISASSNDGIVEELNDSNITSEVEPSSANIEDSNLIVTRPTTGQLGRSRRSYSRSRRTIYESNNSGMKDCQIENLSTKIKTRTLARSNGTKVTLRTVHAIDTTSGNILIDEACEQLRRRQLREMKKLNREQGKNMSKFSVKRDSDIEALESRHNKELESMEKRASADVDILRSRLIKDATKKSTILASQFKAFSKRLFKFDSTKDISKRHKNSDSDDVSDNQWREALELLYVEEQRLLDAEKKQQHDDHMELHELCLERFNGLMKFEEQHLVDISTLKIRRLEQQHELQIRNQKARQAMEIDHHNQKLRAIQEKLREQHREEEESMLRIQKHRTQAWKSRRIDLEESKKLEYMKKDTGGKKYKSMIRELKRDIDQLDRDFMSTDRSRNEHELVQLRRKHVAELADIQRIHAAELADILEIHKEKEILLETNQSDRQNYLTTTLEDLKKPQQEKFWLRKHALIAGMQKDLQNIQMNGEESDKALQAVYNERRSTGRDIINVKTRWITLDYPHQLFSDFSCLIKPSRSSAELHHESFASDGGNDESDLQHRVLKNSNSVNSLPRSLFSKRSPSNYANNEHRKDETEISKRQQYTKGSDSSANGSPGVFGFFNKSE